MPTNGEISAAAIALFQHCEKKIAWDQISGATRKAWRNRAELALKAAEKAKKTEMKRRRVKDIPTDTGSVT